MGRLPPAAWAYLLSLVLCAGLALWQSSLLLYPPESGALVVCLVMVVGLILADTHMIELTHATKVSVSTALEFALLLMVGPALAVWSIVIATAFTARWHMQRAWKWYNVAFYAANSVLSVGAAGAVYQKVSAGAPLFSSNSSALAVALSSITYFFLNVGIVAVMVALAKKSDSLASFISAFRVAAPQFAGLLTLGLVTAAVYFASPIAALLLAIPMVGVYASMRSILSLRAETEMALEALANEVDQYHPYTAQHSARVARYSAMIAHKMQLGEEQVEMITRAARIHDVGKLGIWLGMLNKASGLTPEEMNELRTHSTRGAELVSRFPDYRNGRDLILYHHERYDGKGYPSGLKGDEIPLGARIIAVADSTDAMRSDRPYRKALSAAEAMGELARNRGTQFDPDIAAMMVEILEIEERTQIRQPSLAPAPV